MDTLIFLAGLFLFTMLAFLGYAWVDKRRTEEKLNDPNAPKSALATDGPGPNPVTAPRGDHVDPSGGGATPQGDRRHG